MKRMAPVTSILAAADLEGAAWKWPAQKMIHRDCSCLHKYRLMICTNNTGTFSWPCAPMLAVGVTELDAICKHSNE
jgi:hypothetical protein